MMLFIGRCVLIFCCHVLVTCQSSLSDVTYDLFGNLKSGVVAAFGDFNADKLTDIFVLSDDGKQVYLLQAEQDVTKKRAGFSRKHLIANDGPQGQYISSLVPGDFDGDAQMDLLLTRKKENSEKSEPVSVHIYWGNSVTNTLDSDKALTLNERLRDQPAVIDVNGDMIPDLLGEISDSGIRTYFILRSNRSYTVQTVTNGTSSDSLAKLRIPQSSAFYDFNGDLIPDLCVVSEVKDMIQFEIWLNQNGVLTWKTTIQAPPEMKQFGRASFYDLNDNHEINIILPGCLENGDCSKSVVYVWGREQWHNLQLDFGQGTAAWHFSINSLPLPWVDIPLVLRFGDFNLDGYPDALAVLQSNGNESYATFLLLNIPSSGNFSRTFQLDLSKPLSVESKHPPLAAFYDFMENGILDVLLTVYDKDTPELKALEQDFTADAYFLKVMVVSGLCSDNCHNGHKPYGVNQIGPVIRFQTTTSTGDTEIGVDTCVLGDSWCLFAAAKPKQCIWFHNISAPLGFNPVGNASQLSQSAYYSLQLPFEVFGLGQTPNFVDLLEVGIQNPVKAIKRERSWTSIIPNSQVVVIPHPLDSPASWHTKLFVTPSRLVLLTGVSLLSTCAFIAIIIVLLHWRERVEDKKEKLQESQRFHFDAM